MPAKENRSAERLRKCVPAPSLVACLMAMALPAMATDYRVPGTTLVFKSYIEGEGGYDSNPDNSTREIGSAFEKVQGGVNISSKTAARYIALDIKARDIHFNALEREDRWDLRVGLDTEFDLGDGKNLKFGGYFLRDFVFESPADLGETYATYSKKGDDYRFKVHTKSHVEHNLDDDIQGSLDQATFDIIRNEAFDYARSDLQTSFITFTNTPLQPFVLFDVARIRYFNQVSGAEIDRDASEGFAIAGMRFEFDKTFRIDVGGRYSNRNFDDKVVRDASRAFIDINAYWKPTDTFSASFVVERFFKEPTTSFGLADDVRTVGTTIDWRFQPKWRFNWAAYYDRVEPIGDDLKYNKFSSTAALTYEPTDNIEWFLSGLVKFSDEQVEGSNYERYKIGSGVRYKF